LSWSKVESVKWREEREKREERREKREEERVWRIAA